MDDPRLLFRPERTIHPPGVDVEAIERLARSSYDAARVVPASPPSPLDRFEGRRTMAQCEEAWTVYEQLAFCVAFGAPEAVVERYRVWLDRELLITHIED